MVRKSYTGVSLLAAILLLTPVVVRADGEPSGYLDNSGVIVPLDEEHARVLGQRIEITLPEPSKPGAIPTPADVRVEYLLDSWDKKKPLDINVAWPTGGMSGHIAKRHDPEYPVDIKLDGKPVSFKMLRYEDLAAPYVSAWLKRIDDLLTKKPELKRRVLQMRRAHPIKDWTAMDSASFYKLRSPTMQLGKWMVKQGLLRKGFYYHHPQSLAAGLLGFPSEEGGPRDWTVQDALQWLDPTHKRVNLREVFVERWGYGSVLLDPVKRRLVYVETTLGGPPDFAVIRFPIRLLPKKQHRLVVRYKQQLGGTRGEDWKGLAYLMEPARRWGRWEKTTMVIRAPLSWTDMVIRPHARSVGRDGKSETYRIDIEGRPYENLYISMVPRTAGAGSARSGE